MIMPPALPRKPAARHGCLASRAGAFGHDGVCVENSSAEVLTPRTNIDIIDDPGACRVAARGWADAFTLKTR
jgi:hypothetical protein